MFNRRSIQLGFSGEREQGSDSRSGLFFVIWQSCCLPGSALGTDLNVLDLKMTNFSTTPVVEVESPLTGFSKPVLFPWQSFGTSQPNPWLWLLFGFYPGCGWRNHPLYPLKTEFVSPVLTAWPRGNHPWSAEREQLIGVVPGLHRWFLSWPN